MARQSAEREQDEAQADLVEDAALFSGEPVEVSLRSGWVSLPREAISINGVPHRLIFDADAMERLMVAVEEKIPETTSRGRNHSKPEMHVQFPLVDSPPGINPLRDHKKNRSVDYHQQGGFGVVEVRVMRGWGHSQMTPEQSANTYGAILNDALTYGLIVHLLYSSDAPKGINRYKTAARITSSLGGIVGAATAESVWRVWPLIWRSATGAAIGAGAVAGTYGLSRIELFASKSDRMGKAIEMAKREDNRFAALYAIDPLSLVPENPSDSNAETAHSNNGAQPYDQETE